MLCPDHPKLPLMLNTRSLHQVPGVPTESRKPVQLLAIVDQSRRSCMRVLGVLGLIAVVTSGCMSVGSGPRTASEVLSPAIEPRNAPAEPQQTDVADRTRTSPKDASPALASIRPESPVELKAVTLPTVTERQLSQPAVDEIVLQVPAAKPETNTAPKKNTTAGRQRPAIVKLKPAAIHQVKPSPTPSVTWRNNGDEQTVALHFDDLEIRKALELLSRQGSLNILVSPKVTGNVTANIEGLTLEQALNAILKLCGLVANRENNLIYVYTPEELRQLDNQNTDDKIGTRVYLLDHLRAEDLQTMIQPFLTKEIGKVTTTPASDVGIESDRDKVGGDSLAGGDVLIVQDYETVLQTIDKIVEQIDIQPVQVVIEAVILEVTINDDIDLGTNFAVLDGAANALAVLGSGAALNAAAGFKPAELLTTGGKLVDGFTKGGDGLSFGFVDNGVSGFVHALEAVADVNVVASPRVLALNKQRAELIIGERIGFKTLTVTQTSTVENVQFLNVGTQLRLRPFVTSNGLIRMEVHPEQSSGDVVNGVPRSRTSEVTSNVLIPNGATLVIAGLMEEKEAWIESGVPGLQRIPVLGHLFRRTTRSTSKKELIVLLTPKIWNPVGESPPAPLDAIRPDPAPNLPNPKRHIVPVTDARSPGPTATTTRTMRMPSQRLVLTDPDQQPTRLSKPVGPPLNNNAPQPTRRVNSRSGWKPAKPTLVLTDE